MPSIGAWLQARRASYVAYVERNVLIWELTMAGLALAFVAIGLLAGRADGGVRGALLTVGWIVTIVFVAEFASRLATAPDPRAYVRGHWIDLLALVPILRAARVLSLLRFLPIVPGVARVAAAFAQVQHSFRHRAQLWLFLAWLALMLACSLFLYGYAVSPSSGVGRLAGGVLLVMGLAMFSAITAALTNILLNARHDPASELSEQLRALSALREAGLVTSDEYGTRRAAIMHSLTPHERGQSTS
jgi:voltage-gated potassium channel